MRRQVQGVGAARAAPLAFAAALLAAGATFAAAPAPPAAPRELATDQKRDELIADLQRLLPRMEDGPRRADLLFELAEYHWERARSLSLREVKAYDESYGRWLAVRDAKGAAAAGPEPRVSTQASDAARGEALAVYRSLLARYPRYARRDEVLFVLAYDLYESGAKDEALRTYRRLIAEHPDSRFVPDAWVQLGEHAFAENDLARAREAYEHAASGAKAKVYAFALYKLAWCDANAGDSRGAVAKFKQVIEYSQAQAQAGGARGDRIQLASEALKDLVLAFAQLDEVDPAVAYFKEKDGARALDWIGRLGATYFESGKFELAIRVYRLLEAEAPAHPRAPAWQQKIALSYDKLNLRAEVAREVERLLGDYGAASSWAKLNAGDREALAAAAELSEEAVRALVQDYHQEAVRTRSAATLRLARDLYRQYLASFPSAEPAGRFRFYFAEVLYALGEWEAAAEQYDAVAAAGPKDETARRAAGNQLLALEKALAAQKAATPPAPAPGGPAAPAPAQPATAEPIPALEARLLRACDRYLEVASPAKDEVAVRYKAALILYDHRRPAEAAKRFAEIIRRWPGDPWAQKAADLSMDILEADKDWSSLSALAGRFHQDARLAPPGSELWRRTATVAENARFYGVLELAQGKKDPAAAAREFTRFADAYPHSRNAAVALYNAVVLAEGSGELDRVIASGERFLRDHPQADAAIAKPTLLSLASACLRTARFEEAVLAKLAFVDRFPGDPRAPEELVSAALWKEAVGDDGGAIVLWQRFLRTFASRPEAVQVAFNLALSYERRKDWPRALAAWASFRRTQRRGATRGELVIARYREAIALEALHRSEARTALSDVVAAYRALPEAERLPKVSDAAAHARFLLAERSFAEFLALRFTSNRQPAMVAVLKSRNARLAQLVAAYAEVIQLGSPSWSEAALTRLGAAYRDLNQALLDAPAPRGLDPEQQELYRSALEQQALPLEDKAVEAFEKALEIGARLGAYTEWTLRAQELLREVRPDAHRESHAARWAFGEPSWREEPVEVGRSRRAGEAGTDSGSASGGRP